MLIPDSAKKHCIIANARNANIRDRDAVRRAFLWAFRAFPASSPSTPNSSRRIEECFRRFSCNSPVFLIASSGVSLLNFPAGIHADIHIVRIVTSSVRAQTQG